MKNITKTKSCSLINKVSKIPYISSCRNEVIREKMRVTQTISERRENNM
jgi:hypothetical protein